MAASSALISDVLAQEDAANGRRRSRMCCTEGASHSALSGATTLVLSSAQPRTLATARDGPSWPPQRAMAGVEDTPTVRAHTAVP